MTETYNIDCMEYMRTLPDKAFDLAVVDPPYGGGSQIGNVERERERERERETGLRGGAADYEYHKRSRFGGRFSKYHIDDPDRRDMGGEISDPHRGYL